MSEINPMGTIVDNIITLLERKNAQMNVNVLEKLSNVDHKRFKSVLDFLVKFKFMEYDPHDKMVKLSNLLFNQVNHELSSEQKFRN